MGRLAHLCPLVGLVQLFVVAGLILSLRAARGRQLVLEAEVASLTNAWNQWGGVINDGHQGEGDTLIPIVLYVWKRPHYLSRVLEALRGVKGIDRTLLVVSQDGVVPEVMDLVHSIDFCAVKSIVHPLPGDHLGVQGPGRMALKDHWWWMQEEFWERVAPTHAGYAVFIEEDHLLSPDSLEVLQWLVATLVREGGISVGSHWHDRAEFWGVALADISGRPMREGADPSDFQVRAGYTNTGYAFDRTTWNQLRAHQEEFDAFPDGWDWAFYHLQQRRWLPQLFLLPELSRISNIGAEGANMDPAQFEKAGLGRTEVATATRRLVEAQASVTAPPGGGDYEGTPPAGEAYCWLCSRCSVCEADGFEFDSTGKVPLTAIAS